MSDTSTRIRSLRALSVLALCGALGGCSLDVANPTLVTPDAVEGREEMLQPFVNGIEASWRRSYGWQASSGAAASDETAFGHVWAPWNEYDRRKVTPDGISTLGFPFLAQTIAAGEVYSGEIEKLVGAAADKSPALAGALAYTGFAYGMTADLYCEVVVDGAKVQPAAAYTRALERLTRAASIATAAGADGRHWLNLANVGIARTNLSLGRLPDAITAARKVDADFAAHVRYAPHPDFGNWTFYNIYARTSGFKSPVEFNQGIGPANAQKLLIRPVPGQAGKFTWDRRVPFQSDSVTLLMGGWNAPRYAYVPYSPSSFGGYNPDNPKIIGEGEAIRFASGLEAKYIIAEASLRGGAGGWSQAEVRNFINERRAFGGLAPFSGTDLFAELRYNRMLDFYLAGFRFQDLRRYKERYAIDEFPTGPLDGFLTGSAPESYGSDTCWPLPTGAT
jgi:hypothetical protein